MSRERAPRPQRREAESEDKPLNEISALQKSITTAGNGVSELSGTYTTPGVTTDQSSKIHGNGARIIPTTNDMAVLVLLSHQGLQSSDFKLVRDLRIDSGGKVRITGLLVPIGTGEASLILENVYAFNCDTGFELNDSQFVRSNNLRASGGRLGMLIRSTQDIGGGNSHDHYGLHVVGAQVGVVVNGTRFPGGCHSINFGNPQILDCSVCGFAFFDANATTYGGAPELNAHPDGARSMVVDGQTVKRSSYYLHNSLVRVVNLHSGEPSANPHFLLESNSVLVLENFDGYGGTASDALLVEADDTSGVALSGLFSGQGTVQNVLSWPDAFRMPATAQVALYGAAVHTVDTTIAPLYAEQATEWIGSGNAAPITAFVEDPDLGFCSSLAFKPVIASFAGNTGCARVELGNGAANQDTLLSCLVKSDVDCNVKVDVRTGAKWNQLNPTTIRLKRGVVTRIVAARRGLDHDSLVLYFGPNDNTGATIKIANLQCYQGPAGTARTDAALSGIVKHGSFFPGSTRESAANLRDKHSKVNTQGKYPGKQVWDITGSRTLVAAGREPAASWRDGTNARIHTPA